MFCYKCGANLEDNSNFCVVCGTRLNDAKLTTIPNETKSPEEPPVQSDAIVEHSTPCVVQEAPIAEPVTSPIGQQAPITEPAPPPVIQQAPIVEQTPVQNATSTETSQKPIVKQLIQLIGVYDEAKERAQKIPKQKVGKVANKIITAVSLLLCVGWIAFSLVWFNWHYWAEQIAEPIVVFLFMLESPFVVPLAVLLVAEKIKFIIHKFSVKEKK